MTSLNSLTTPWRRCNLIASRLSGKKLECTENIIPIAQPSPCDEFNAIERLRQPLKGKCKGEKFSSLETLQQLVDQKLSQLEPSLVKSLTSFDFILDAPLQGAFKITLSCSSSYRYSGQKSDTCIACKVEPTLLNLFNSMSAQELTLN